MIPLISQIEGLRVDLKPTDGYGEIEEIDISESVNQFSFWVTNQAGDGLKLVMPTAAGNTDVQRKDGQTVMVKWDDLLNSDQVISYSGTLDDAQARLNIAMREAMSYPVGKSPESVNQEIAAARKALDEQKAVAKAQIALQKRNSK